MPAMSEVAVEPAAGVSEIPPTVVLRLKVTVLPLNGLPPPSTTLKATIEDEAPPVPAREIEGGVAETNCIEPTVGGVT